MKTSRGSSRAGTTSGAGGNDRTGAGDGPTAAVPATPVWGACDGRGRDVEWSVRAEHLRAEGPATEVAL